MATQLELWEGQSSRLVEAARQGELPCPDLPGEPVAFVRLHIERLLDGSGLAHVDLGFIESMPVEARIRALELMQEDINNALEGYRGKADAN